MFDALPSPLPLEKRDWLDCTLPPTPLKSVILGTALCLFFLDALRTGWKFYYVKLPRKTSANAPVFIIMAGLSRQNTHAY